MGRGSPATERGTRTVSYRKASTGLPGGRVRDQLCKVDVGPFDRVGGPGSLLSDFQRKKKKKINPVLFLS